MLGDSVMHVYLPYDLPWLARRFLSHFKPRLGIIMETEIWPNLFAAAEKLDIPLLIANGRLSERSMRGYVRLSSLITPALRPVRRIAAQSEADAARYVAIGAKEASVINVGNIKYDIDWTLHQVRDSLSLRHDWFGDRKVIVAGSTHPGEEELVLAAFRRVRERFADAVLIIVPRHPERGRSVEGLCLNEGYAARRLTEITQFKGDDDILVIDKVGELRRFYGTAQLAYIGGSLVPHGGQNPLEPLVAGVPVIFGPYMNNFKEISHSILEAGAGMEVLSDTELSEQLIRLLAHPDTARDMGKRGESLIRHNQGAVNRIYEITAELLG